MGVPNGVSCFRPIENVQEVFANNIVQDAHIKDLPGAWLCLFSLISALPNDVM